MPKTFVRPSNLYYRSGSGGSQRPATPNTEYNMYEEGTRIIFNKAYTFSHIFPLNGSYNNLLGMNVFFRIKFNSNFTYLQFSGWYNGNLFPVVKPSLNAWHTVQVIYGATATSTHKWYFDGVLKYSGTLLTGPDFYYTAKIGGEVFHDIGQYGGVLPAGASWWPSSTVF